MTKKSSSHVAKILSFLGESFEYLPAPFETPYSYMRRVDRIPYKRYYDSVYQMKRRKVVDVFQKNGKKFIKLTHKGQLEILLHGLRTDRKSPWDGRWRVVIFDIPETARKHRATIRRLLRQDGFIRFQNSVFISPYQLNRQSVEYLKKTHLINYIRVMRVDELDDDKDLRVRFKLSKK